MLIANTLPPKLAVAPFPALSALLELARLCPLQAARVPLVAGGLGLAPRRWRRNSELYAASDQLRIKSDRNCQNRKLSSKARQACLRILIQIKRKESNFWATQRTPNSLLACGAFHYKQKGLLGWVFDFRGKERNVIVRESYSCRL